MASSGRPAFPPAVPRTLALHWELKTPRKIVSARVDDISEPELASLILSEINAGLSAWKAVGLAKGRVIAKEVWPGATTRIDEEAAVQGSIENSKKSVL